MGPCVRRDDTEICRHRTARFRKSFRYHDNLFPETGRKTSRSSANDDEINPVSDHRRCFHHRRI